MRNIFPDRPDYTTKAHQDYPNVQGTTEVYTAWMPLIDCPPSSAGSRWRTALTCSACSSSVSATAPAASRSSTRWTDGGPAAPCARGRLPFIGVDLARQGLGLGSLLLRAGLSRVDQDGIECRLFTEQPRNVTLYQRYGFEIAVDGEVPDEGPHFWFMRRGPRPITL
jgi:GNAT superfamily N-acetyltransferase